MKRVATTHDVYEFVARKGAWGAAALALWAFAGCAQPETTVVESPPPSGVLGEFELFADPANGRFELTQSIDRSASGLSEATVVQDGVPASGPLNTLELVTTNGANDLDGNGACGYPSSYCGTVTVRSFYTAALGSVFAHVASVSPASGHTGLNSDGASNGLSNALGLWSYGGLAAGGSSSRTWVFSDDGTAFLVRGRIMADLCSNGIQDGDETDVDCGGSPCAACATCVGCAAEATCEDVAGTWTCVCGAGYSGDGTTCTDVDECAAGTDNCQLDQSCFNSAGSFSCGPCETEICSGECVDILSNPDHCGSCGDPCAGEQACANAVCVGSGNLGVSLVWTRPGDLDLWVRTPSGNMIGYSNMGPDAATDFGQQDRDDTTGTGPENIYWDTAYTPPVGTYHVCADTYSFSPAVSGGDPLSWTVVITRPGRLDVTLTGTYTADARVTTCLPGDDAYVGSFNNP